MSDWNCLLLQNIRVVLLFRKPFRQIWIFVLMLRPLARSARNISYHLLTRKNYVRKLRAFVGIGLPKARTVYFRRQRESSDVCQARRARRTASVFCKRMTNPGWNGTLIPTIGHVVRMDTTIGCFPLWFSMHDLEVTISKTKQLNTTPVLKCAILILRVRVSKTLCAKTGQILLVNSKKEDGNVRLLALRVRTWTGSVRLSRTKGGSNGLKRVYS